MPYRKYITATSTVLFLGIVFVILQVWNTKQRIDLSRELEESPLEFSEWTTEKTEYRQGDLIKFNYTRTTKAQKEPLLIVFADFFENSDTGEIYRAASAPKKIRTWGSEQIVQARRIPIDCSPGRYTLQGLAVAQTTRLSRTIGYSSSEFSVINLPGQ